MDKNCQLVIFSGDHLIIKSGPISYPPAVNCNSIVVIPEGELSTGIYYYAITSIGVNGESTFQNILQIKVTHLKSSIILTWDPIPFITEYRVYRGISPNYFDGFFTIFTKTGHFQDNGMGELNMIQKRPPAFTGFSDRWDRSIHRKSIKKINSLFLGGEPHTIHVYLVLFSGEIVIIDLMKVLNQPGWSSSHKHGLLRAITEIGEWIDAGKS